MSDEELEEMVTQVDTITCSGIIFRRVVLMSDAFGFRLSIDCLLLAAVVNKNKGVSASPLQWNIDTPPFHICAASKQKIQNSGKSMFSHFNSLLSL
jgi:hypothetical protein